MYDYYEAVKEDILTYVKENVDMENIDYDFDELREKLNEELYTVDSVTGKASGSYTFCTPVINVDINSGLKTIYPCIYIPTGNISKSRGHNRQFKQFGVNRLNGLSNG